MVQFYSAPVACFLSALDKPAHCAPHSHQGGHRQSPQPALTTATVSAASGCPRLGCWCNWTAAITPGWRTGDPNSPLLLAVDDATGTVANAVFRTGEDTRGYFMLLEGLIQRWGIPLALYSDRHAVFKHNARKPETAAEATQFTQWPAGGGTADLRPLTTGQGSEWSAWRRPFRTGW